MLVQHFQQISKRQKLYYSGGKIIKMKNNTTGALENFSGPLQNTIIRHLAMLPNRNFCVLNLMQHLLLLHMHLTLILMWHKWTWKGLYVLFRLLLAIVFWKTLKSFPCCSNSLLSLSAEMLKRISEIKCSFLDDFWGYLRQKRTFCCQE